MDILINDKKVDFSLNDLPILVSGAEKTGSSFFTVCLLANFAKSGPKIIFFSAHPAAKEELRAQLGEEDLKNALIINSEKEGDFINIIKNIPDLSERVVLIKNIDSYSQKIFETVKGLKNIIFSGDLDKCQFANSLLEHDFASKIFFSYSEKNPLEEVKSLSKYSGLIVSKKSSGIIRLGV